MNYNETQPTFQLDVLGTIYGVYMGVQPQDDGYLKECDGYCDKTAKRIVVAGEDDRSDLADWTAYERTNLRHEIIHAFLYESGLDGNSYWEANGGDHPEQVVQWLAIQFPKLIKAFQLAGAL